MYVAHPDDVRTGIFIYTGALTPCTAPLSVLSACLVLTYISLLSSTFGTCFPVGDALNMFAEMV